MHHVSGRHLSVRHLKLLMVVYLINKAFNKTQPDKKMISTFARLDVESLEPEMGDLVEKRYLTEVVPKYGEMKLTYKMGPMGGTLIRHMFGSKGATTTTQ